MNLTNQNTQPLSSPLNDIAVALSGGGYRAAAFSLGMLSYLDHLKINTVDKDGSTLLDNVHFIASASGGTITGMLYSLYRHQGRSFRECYDKLTMEMKGESLLNRVIEILNDDSAWDPSGLGKQRNFINAFSKAYDEILFAGAKFEVFLNTSLSAGPAVCFNTTEFYKGISFRFQGDGNPDSQEFIGNEYIYFNHASKDIYQQIRLGDIMASSSCFPGGFEPMVFPSDFSYADKETTLSPSDLMKTVIISAYDTSTKPLEQPMGLMDGGVNDNQALYSTMLADDRRRNTTGKGYDLILINDVASYFMDPYLPPGEEKPVGWRGKNISYYLKMLKRISKGAFISMLISLVVLAASIYMIGSVKDSNYNKIGYLLFGMSFIPAIILIIFYRYKRSNGLFSALFSDPSADQIRAMLQHMQIADNFSSPVLDKILNYLGKAKLNHLAQMGKARLYSVMSMVMDVTLKQTRRLIFKLFYDNPTWANRKVFNVIYELSTFNKSNHAWRINNKLKWPATPSDKALLLDDCGKLETIAEEARTMGTTLWFDGKDDKNGMLEKIIGCGQFTTCSNLLEYILSIERSNIPLGAEEQIKLNNIKTQVLDDWQKFKQKPLFLLSSL